MATQRRTCFGLDSDPSDTSETEFALSDSTESNFYTFEINDLVWVRRRGKDPRSQCGYWPGRVSEPIEGLNKRSWQSENCKCIFFFGFHKFEWIAPNRLKPYFLFKERYYFHDTSEDFKLARMEIEKYIEASNVQNDGTRFDLTKIFFKP